MNKNTTGYLKKFKQSEWKAMPVIAEPTMTTGQIRKDADGVAWVWATGGKYVHARHFPHAEHISPSLAPASGSDAAHASVEMKREPRSEHYSNRNWSARFTCPTCGISKRQNTNFLGTKKMVCNGVITAPSVALNDALPRSCNLHDDCDAPNVSGSGHVGVRSSR